MNNSLRLCIFLIGALVIGAINGLFGGGGGILAILLAKMTLSFDDKVAHSTTVVAMGLVSIPTLITYCICIPFNIFTALCVGIGTIVGSILGSFFMEKISPKFLNILLILILLLSGIKMFF